MLAVVVEHTVFSGGWHFKIFYLGRNIPTPPPIVYKKRLSRSAKAPTKMESHEQAMAILYIMQSKDNVLLSGAAGTGKSHVLGRLCEELKAASRTFTLTALTGAAAALLAGAQTLHSALGVGLLGNTVEEHVKALRRASSEVKRAWAATTLIVDEISMLSGADFVKLEAVARGVRRSARPFGGMRLVLVGDLLQLPPVGKGDADFVFASESWRLCRVALVQLEVNMRQEAGSALELCLAKLRVGVVDAGVEAFLRSCVREPPSDTVVTELHGNNAAVDAINAARLAQLRATGARHARFEAEVELHEEAQREALARHESLVPRSVELAVGAEVMLTKNLRRGDSGLVNGSRGRVVGFDGPTGLPIVRFVGVGTAMVKCAEYPFELVAGTVAWTFRQLPLRLAYALTVHKAQGMTLHSVVVDMRCIFQKGQGYVALSRMRTQEGLYIRNLNLAGISASETVLEFLGKR